MSADVHMLRDVKEGTFAARCGEKRKARELPGDFTAWESDVTCSGCRL